MPLTVQNGALVVRGGSLATEQACCCLLPNCCEAENVLLQITLEISGLQDNAYTGCGCLDGTYVADVYDVLWDGTPYSGFGSKVFPQPGCTVTAPGPVELVGSVFLEWSCTGTYGLGDIGFRAAPATPPGYPATDQIRIQFSNGVACVGGSANAIDANPFFDGCDTSNVVATLTIEAQ